MRSRTVRLPSGLMADLDEWEAYEAAGRRAAAAYRTRPHSGVDVRCSECHRRTEHRSGKCRGCRADGL